MKLENFEFSWWFNSKKNPSDIRVTTKISIRIYPFAFIHCIPIQIRKFYNSIIGGPAQIFFLDQDLNNEKTELTYIFKYIFFLITTHFIPKQLINYFYFY